MPGMVQGDFRSENAEVAATIPGVTLFMPLWGRNEKESAE